MNTTSIARGLAVGAALCLGQAQAQTVSWSEAVDAAWQRTTAAAEAEGAARRAVADRKVADAWWAAPPAVELRHRDDRLQSDRGVRETEFGIVVPVWMPGQRGTQREAALAGLEAAESASRASRWRLAATVREAAWAVAIERAEVASAQAQSAALSSLAADVDRRVSAGELARADALAARAEALAADSVRAGAQQRLRRAELSWEALTGLSAVPDMGVEVTAPVPAVHPALQATAQSVEAARRRVDAVKASRRSSPPELIARVRQDVSGRGEARDHSLGLAIRIPLATEDRNAPRLANSLSELALAEAAEQELRVRIATDLAAAEGAVRAIEDQLLAEQERGALLRERAGLVQRSFRAGESSLPETLRALASAQQAEAEAEAQRQQVALGLARARMQHARGVSP